MTVSLLTLFSEFLHAFLLIFTPLKVSSLRRYHRKYVCHQEDCACEEDLQSSVTQHFASLVSDLRRFQTFKAPFKDV